MKMKEFRIITGRIVTLLLIAFCIIMVMTETHAEDSEQGLEEIRPLLEIAELSDTEGMGLEEMTDVLEEAAMSEYKDSATGFSMQYPAIFLFDEESNDPAAFTADRKASLTIESMDNLGGLDETVLKDAIRFESPDADIRKNEQNGCLRVDRITGRGEMGQTDLYFITDKSFHHITIRYPSDEKERFFSYIEYMINTMETNDTDVG